MVRRDLRTTFIPEPKAPEEKGKENEKEETGGEKQEQDTADAAQKEDEKNQEGTKKTGALVIDLEGITTRALPFPVAEGKYTAVRGIKGKALFLSFPIEGSIGENHEPKGHIDSYDFEAYKYEYLIDSVNNFDLSRDNKTLMYRSRQRLRLLKPRDNPPNPHNVDPTNPPTASLHLHH